MQTGVYSFSVGEFDCIALLDSFMAYPISTLFAGVPRVERDIVRTRVGERSEEIIVPYICLAVQTAAGWVLVDSGLGFDEEHPDVGQLLPNLHAAGIEPAEIATVILTHGRGDHIGGATVAEGVPVYPNARYVMHQAEWDFWNSEEILRKAGREEAIPFYRAALPSIAGRFDLIDGETELLPGVRAIPAVGHTPGHLVVEFSSQGERLLYISDLVAHPLHVEHPDWTMVFDRELAEAVATRRQWLERAADDGSLVFAFHFPFPGLGHIVPEGTGFRWSVL